MCVYKFAQKQTRLRNVDRGNCLLAEGPLNMSWYFKLLRTALGILKAGTKIIFQPFLRSISLLLEGVIQCLGSLRGKCSFQS